MKKILWGTILCLFLITIGSTQAMALSVMLDIEEALSAHDYGDADGITGIFEQFTFKAQTTTIQYGSGPAPAVGDAFLDAGDLYMTDYAAPVVIDTEGLNQFGGHEFTASWDDISGYISAIDYTNPADVVQTLVYTGGTLEMYVDDAMNRNFGGSYGSGDNTGFDDGTHVATLSLISGIGYAHFNTLNPGDPMTQGSTDFIAGFDWVLDDFWLDQLGVDLKEQYVDFGWLLAIADQNTDHIITIPSDDDGVLFTIDSDHDGSLELSVVPEPGTILLLGFGMIGLACVGRRRLLKKK